MKKRHFLKLTLFSISVLSLAILGTSKIESHGVEKVKPNLGKEQKIRFDDIKQSIAKYESANGSNKLAINVNIVGGKIFTSVDCGRYQINSSHFQAKSTREINKIYNKIFDYYGISRNLHDRVGHALIDDKLNEDLARVLYNLKGLKSWVPYKQILADYKKIEKAKK
jgi:hypothetical protein